MNEDLLILGRLGKDQQATIHIQDIKKNKLKPFWRMGKTVNIKRKEILLSQEMEKLSKGAHWLFWRLQRIRDEYTNIAVLTPKDATEQKKIYRAYRELEKLNIVKRTKRAHYIINPNVMGPWSGEEERVQLAWIKATKPQRNKDGT